MKSWIRTRRLVALLGAMTLVISACGGGDDDTEAQPTDGETAATADATESETGGQAVEGGTVVFGADQEPEILNPILTEGNLFANGLIATAVLHGAYGQTPEFEYVPELAEASVVSESDPFTVEWQIMEDAQWSDGTPVTSEDFVFTNEVMNNEELDITSRVGHELITGSEVVDDKTVRFEFSEPFAAYKTIFAPVLPAHDLQDADISTVWNEEITVGTGPYQFESWDQGQQLTLTKVEDYWNDPQPSIDQVVLRFIEDSQAQVQALRGGEIDMFYPQPQVDLIDQVEGIDGVEFEVGAGPIFEHVDLNYGNPALAMDHVRKAIAYGIDRQAIVDRLIAPMYDEASVLNNLIYVSNHPNYEEHFDQYGYDPEAAEAQLTDNGCTQGDDGIYTCDGERLSFDFVFTAGNEARQLQFEIIQAQLAEIGIEVNDASGEAATVFGDVLPSSDWEIFAFAWVGNSDPVGNQPIYSCEGTQNYQNYCNEEVSSLLQQANATPDEQERADLFNQADQLMSDDMPSLPLYQKPTFFAWNSSIQGPQDNATTEGPFWNINEWTLTE